MTNEQFIEVLQLLSKALSHDLPTLTQNPDDYIDDWELRHMECPNCGVEAYNVLTGRCSRCYDDQHS